MYLLAEKFKSIQGEGVFAGTPMAFIRLTECSVGKTICQHCDTDFDRAYVSQGGGLYYVPELIQWARPFKHICITGGEPFDHDLAELISVARTADIAVHIETSGTILPPLDLNLSDVHICVSPKPGWLDEMIELATEIKVIVHALDGGLGSEDGLIRLKTANSHDLVGRKNFTWPTLEHARYWARRKVVFLQPRNGKFEVEQNNLRLCEELVRQYPELRLSVQMHKILRVR